MTNSAHMSDAFQIFMKEAPAHQEAWLEAVKKIGAASKLDPKTEALIYIGILAATRLHSGLPFHVAEAKQHGATREEVVSAILAGLPALGNVVIQALPAALQAYDK